MDSVLHTLYRTYFLLNGLCISGEDVQFANKKNEVVILVRAQEIRLSKLDETIVSTAKKNSMTNRSLCEDLDGNRWIFEYDKSKSGYELYFKKEDGSYEARVSNQKICGDDH